MVRYTKCAVNTASTIIAHYNFVLMPHKLRIFLTYRFPLPFLILLAFGFSFLSAFSAFGSAPETFSQAKIILKEQIYFDQNQNGSMGTIYCGCDWQWVGRSGGKLLLKQLLQIHENKLRYPNGHRRCRRQGV